MIDLIKELLLKNHIKVYKIIEEKIESIELFFIKKELDLSRGKDVKKYNVTVYNDFQENGERYRGSSTADIYSTMKEEEIEKILKEAMYSASFVKNRYYDIPEGKKEEVFIVPSSFFNLTLEEGALKIKEALYKEDVLEKGYINSSEIFLYKNTTRIINSEGVDVTFSNMYSDLEFITQWIEERDIELYNFISFTELKDEYLENIVKESLNKAKYRAKAESGIKSGKYKVILRNDAVKEVFTYYYTNGANVSRIYTESSNFRIGESVQGKDIKGDYVNITLNPISSNSKTSYPWDRDGVKLKKIELIKDGILKSYFGDSRYCYYLGIDPKGTIKNIEVEVGSKTLEEMKKGKYLEVLAFSDFQTETLTGDFAGEIRLGLYSDGVEVVPITGGSISGNIKRVHENMYLSKEIYEATSYKGPRALELYDISVAGD